MQHDRNYVRWMVLYIYMCTSPSHGQLRICTYAHVTAHMNLGYIIMHAHVNTHKIKLYIMYVYCTTKYHMQILHLFFAGSLVEKGQKEATMQSKKWLNQKALQELVSLIILVRSALQGVSDS